MLMILPPLDYFNSDSLKKPANFEQWILAAQAQQWSWIQKK